MNATFRPIGEWPRPEETSEASRRPSPYEIGWKQTLEDLKRELRHLGAEHVVVFLDLAENRIRRDGWPRSDARPSSPRVIVEFQKPDGRWLRYPCDTFDDWEGNMRAIALTLQDLRRAGNRGALAMGEQYEGSTLELEAPAGAGQPFRSADEAARFLAEASGGPGLHLFLPGGAHHTPSAAEHHIRRAYRLAAKNLHPDVRDGDVERFKRLQEARDLLLGSLS